MFTDEDISSQLHEWLLKQSKERLVEIMVEAPQEMQQWNGRSITHCICEGAGFESNDEGKWKYPQSKKVA